MLTESQLAALEKAKSEKEAHGEFESECPGYCGAQDTFYVGTMKGSGVLPADLHRHLRQDRLRQALRCRTRSPRPISSTTVWCPSMISTRSGCAAC